MAARRSRSLRAATLAGAPVPAGMSLPMMTFSLRPIRWSLAPLMAASVSTRVVSWNDAAARKDDVLSDAFVTPRSTVWAVAGSPPSDRTRLLASSKSSRSISSVGQQVDVARLVDADLAEHLPDDDLDVLVVDRHALAAVDLLDFLDQVALDGVLAAGVEVLLRVDRAVGDRVTGPDLLAVLDEDLRVVRDRVLPLDDVLGPEDEPVGDPSRGSPRTGATTSAEVSRSLSLGLAPFSRAMTWLASTRSPGGGEHLDALRHGRATCRRPRCWSP